MHKILQVLLVEPFYCGSAVRAYFVACSWVMPARGLKIYGTSTQIICCALFFVSCGEQLMAQGPGPHHVFNSIQNDGLRAANHSVSRTELCVHVQSSNNSISKCVAKYQTCTSNLLCRIPSNCPCEHIINATLFPCDRSRLMETQGETHIRELFRGFPSSG